MVISRYVQKLNMKLKYCPRSLRRQEALVQEYYEILADQQPPPHEDIVKAESKTEDRQSGPR